MSYEDSYFGVEIEFRGYIFTPDQATLHIYTDRKYNHIAIEVKEGEDPEGELISSDEISILRQAGVFWINEDQPSDGVRQWYELEVNKWSGELVLETGEFLDYNA